jgi:hypothetical protein
MIRPVILLEMMETSTFAKSVKVLAMLSAAMAVHVYTIQRVFLWRALRESRWMQTKTHGSVPSAWRGLTEFLGKLLPRQRGREKRETVDLLIIDVLTVIK